MSEKSDSTFKFCEVGSEFQRIFAASPLHSIETFESEERALESLNEPEGQIVPDPVEAMGPMYIPMKKNSSQS